MVKLLNKKPLILNSFMIFILLYTIYSYETIIHLYEKAFKSGFDQECNGIVSIEKQNQVKGILFEIGSNQKRSYIEETNETKRVIEIMDKNKIDDSVIITHINYGFIEILMNLIASLLFNNYTKFVVFCMDEKSFNYLKNKGFESNIVMIPIDWTGIRLSSNFEAFGKLGYNRINNYKPRLFYELLSRGYKILFTDSDTVWLNKNVLNHIKFNLDHSYADILFQQDTNDNKIEYNFGFFYASPTPFSKELLLYLEKNLNKDTDIDQFVFNKLLDRIKHNDNRMGGLDHILYASGQSFFHEKIHNKLQIMPYVVHATYMVGKETKINSFKSRNLWFIDSNGDFLFRNKTHISEI